MKKLTTLMMAGVAASLMVSAANAGSHSKRGADGQLNIIYWQAASILNPFLSGGTKDTHAA